jgi:hypothetical protein
MASANRSRKFSTPRFPARCTRMMKRVVRSSSVAMADRPPFPRIRSPSQYPGTNLPVTSAGLSLIMTTRPTACPSATQGNSRIHGQIQRSTPVQGLIEGLRNHVHFRLSGELRAQAVADLPGTPPLFQVFAHKLPQLGWVAIFPVGWRLRLRSAERWAVRGR